MSNNKMNTVDVNTKLLQDILITQLGVLGVPQASIREIVGVDIVHVNKIMKHIIKAKKKEE